MGEPLRRAHTDFTLELVQSQNPLSQPKQPRIHTPMGTACLPTQWLRDFCVQCRCERNPTHRGDIHNYRKGSVDKDWFSPVLCLCRRRNARFGEEEGNISLKGYL
ncbi:hypothetical protein Nmel_009585 [Mimus melanotis]